MEYIRIEKEIAKRYTKFNVELNTLIDFRLDIFYLLLKNSMIEA